MKHTENKPTISTSACNAGGDASQHPTPIAGLVQHWPKPAEPTPQTPPGVGPNTTPSPEPTCDWWGFLAGKHRHLTQQRTLDPVQARELEKEIRASIYQA